MQLLQFRLFDITLERYGLALLLITGGFVLRQLTTPLLARLNRAANSSRFALDGVVMTAIEGPLRWTFALGGIWLGVSALPLPTHPLDISRFLNALLMSASIILMIIFGTRLVDGLTGLWAARAAETDSRLDDQAVPVVRSSAKSFVVIIGSILILQNLGYSVASLIAGLGLGGAALAFASKDTLSNLFGSLVIFLDRPFQIGDWIEMTDLEGVVEEVGLRTTRVRTFANSQVTVPNMLFTTHTINNWSRMQKRRLKLNLSVAHDTSPEKMLEVVEGVRALLKDNDAFHQDFYMVNFDTIGAHSLDVFIYAFTRTTDWVAYMQTRQDFLVAALSLLSDLDVRRALPAQRLEVDRLPEGAPLGMNRERPL